MREKKETPPGSQPGEGKNNWQLNKSTADYLKFLVRNGAFLVPLPPYPIAEGKEPNAPLVKWTELREKPTWKEIEQWQKTTNRFGIVCGEQSDWLVGIDIDNLETFIGLGLGPLAGQTWTEHRDHKKFHFLVKSTKPIKTQTLRIEGQDGEDISIRGDGAIIACGYCPHAKGGHYERYMQAPTTIKTFESGFFSDFKALWNDFRGVEGIGKRTFSDTKSFKEGTILEIVRACVREDDKELEEFKDEGDTCQFRCPFPGHKDHNPSFLVYKKTDSFYCFGCGKGGNAVNFLVEYYKISKKEARKRLSDAGYIKGKPEEPVIDVLSEVECALHDAEDEIFTGPINFDPELGIFLRVPIETKIQKKDRSPAYMQPIFSTALAGFPQQIEDKEIEKDKFGVLPHKDRINGVLAPVYRLYEGEVIYLSSSLRVELLQTYHALLKTGEIPWKSQREEINRLPAIRHISFFKMLNNIESYIVVCWAIGTYLFPMFPVFPYLIFVGEKGTNKSGHLTFLARICWNPTNKLSIPNEAPLYRLIQQARPTIIIDEAHRVLNNPIYGPSMCALLETGHEKGGCVPRCDDNDRNIINFFKTYCPKLLASREELELEEKSITIVLSKDYDKKYAIARKRLETTPELDIAQKELFHYALLNWKAILDAYNEIEPTDRLAGRYFLLWAPVLAICKVAYPDKYEDMVKYAENAIVGVEKKSYEVEIRVLSFLASRLEFLKKKGNSIYLRELSEPLNLKWQSIFSGLRNLGIIKKDADTGHGKKYYLDIPRIEKLTKERNITIEEVTTCDRCGFDRTTTDFKGELLCDDCLNDALEKEKPDTFAGFEEDEGTEE